MDWQPGPDDGEGNGEGDAEGESPDPARPSIGPGGAAPNPGPAGRDPRLAVFAREESRAGPVPSGRLALLTDQLPGPERRCPHATDNELTGLLQAWAGIESWAAAAKLGVIREMMRRDRLPSPGADHGDLPEVWSDSLRFELAAALACSTQSAERTAWLAWELRARLPGTGALLEDGTFTPPKAKAIADTFSQLMDADAATAEAMIADQLAGKTYSQVMRLAEQAALTVDPELAERRRQQAQKKAARVSFFREQSGTAALSGRDLPPDEALAAMASVNARAEEYRESDAFGDTPMDVLRAYAYLDLIIDRPAADRIANAERQDDAADAAESMARARARAAAGTAAAARPGNGEAQANPDRDGQDAGRAAAVPPTQTDPRAIGSDLQGDPDDCSCADCDGSCLVDDYDLDFDGTGDDGPPDGGSGPRPGMLRVGQAPQRRPADLIVPLMTLLGLAERPGEIHGFGLLDPALARKLAAAGATSPQTEICVTVTSTEGYAVGHGCARPARRSGPPGPPPGPTAFPAASPVRLNLTIPAAALPSLSSAGNSFAGNAASWAFRHSGKQAGTPGGYGSWTLTLPGGRQLTVRLDPVPTFSCDHRYESRGYQPSGKLRHLVQVRDGTCTFPPCNRHARESDFEHALPYDQGGKTCTCNAGARSRACHRVKQSPGWKVTQPRPGWHRWETPSGRVYVQQPKRYPA